MKLKSLLLGSVAAAGLSTGAMAADPMGAVVTSLNVCDLLGISGLTISSETNCLQISGEVKYEFSWGDYGGSATVAGPMIYGGGTRSIDDNNGTAPSELDWDSDLEWWLQFVGSASSDFGTAKAVIKITGHDDIEVRNEGVPVQKETGQPVQFKEAYVSVGDTTTLVAGRRDTSTYVDGDDEPFNFLGLFHSDAVDKGVGALKNHLPKKGHVIQLYHSLGNGVTIQGGLENLNSGTVATQTTGPIAPIVGLTGAQAAGTAIGTIVYKGDGLEGHASFAAGGILDGTVEDWSAHAGFTGTFDQFKLRAAVAGASSTIAAVTTTEWNGLITGEATFDMFKLAASFEAASISQTGATTVTQWGAGFSAGANVTDDVTINAGFRWYDSDTSTANSESWHAALQVVAKLTETLTATGEVGYYAMGTAVNAATPNAFYGSAELKWVPGGQFESSVKGEINSLGAYKATFKASKKFD